MIIIISLTLIIFLLSNLMMLLSMILSKNSLNMREKFSPFECGFDPMSSPRIPFSMHFFLISIIFLIFDIEIALIFPMIMTFNSTNLFYWMMVSIFFFIILLLGIYHEWNQNMLNWSN